MQMISGLGQVWGDVDGRAADLLEIETDPRYTFELLAEWERAFGLPETLDTVIPAGTRFRVGQSHVGLDRLLDLDAGFGFRERGPSPSPNLDDRRSALLAKITAEGGQSKPFFTALAAALGYSVTITEFSPFMVGVSRLGDDRPHTGTMNWFRAGRSHVGVDSHLDLPTDFLITGDHPHRLGPPSNRFVWVVNVAGFRLSWFRVGAGRLGVDRLLSVSPQPRRFRMGVGQVGVDRLVSIERAFDLEAAFRRWKPAQTQVVFNYGQVQ